MASAKRASSTAALRSQLRNITDIGALIERADDLVATIARNRAARPGLGRTGRGVLRDHEAMLDAELAGIREVASHASATTPAEAQFLVALAIVELRDARARAHRHGGDLVAVLDRIARLLDGSRFGSGVADMATDTLSQRLAPLGEGPRLRAVWAMEHIAAAETAHG